MADLTMNKTLVRLGVFIQRLGAYKESAPPKLRAEAEARMWARNSGKAQIALQNETQRRLYYQREHQKAIDAIKILLALVNDDEKEQERLRQ